MSRLLAFAGQALRGLATGRLSLESDAIPYHFERLPRRKILNAVRTESSVFFKPERPWGWPTHLMIEPSSLCNLHCSLCPVSTGLKRPQGMMEMDLFKRVLDEVGEQVFNLQLWGWGEPFLNPNIFEMIAYARGKGVKVISSTNGHLFAREEYADRLVRSGIDSIIFAIDGVTQESYERYRQGGKLETALQGIRNVAARKRALGAKRPLINFRFIVMAQNEEEISRVKTLAPTVGADALTFKTLNPHSVDPYSPSAADPGGGKVFIPRDPRHRRFCYGADLDTRRRRKRNPCKQLWNNPVIHWDGNVISCSYDPREEFPLGSLREKSFAEIWSGESYRRLRRQFRDDWEQMPRCNDCSYAWEGGSCNCETISEAIFYPPLRPGASR
jgi:radical SAM protein with 4Fe4S-binding SPASM domain